MPNETCWICGGNRPLEYRRSIVGTKHKVCKKGTGCDAPRPKQKR
jgi:hypothetical protein